MRLVIDLQVCQGAARQRGMGRYSLDLAKAMIRKSRTHDAVLALSSRYAREAIRIRDEFSFLLPADKIAVFGVPQGVAGNQGNAWRTHVAEKARISSLGSWHPDAVHVCSVFSGFGDDIVTSADPHQESGFQAVTVYDLIPLARSEEFLKQPSFRQWYDHKLSVLHSSDLLFAISEATRTETISLLGIPPEKVVMIGAAISDTFVNAARGRADEYGLLHKHGIQRPFVFYLGGANPHKNMEGMVRAFARIPIALRKNFQLVLAGEFTSGPTEVLQRCQAESGLDANDLVIVQDLPDADLAAFYSMCRVFVFPSFHEGFGLPILEAMSCGAPVIASGTTSIPEVIGLEEALFDPTDPDSIAQKTAAVLESESFRSELIRHGLQQSRKFSWQAVAEKAWDALEIAHDARSSAKRVSGVTLLKEGVRSVLVVSKLGGDCDYIEILKKCSRVGLVDSDCELVIAKSDSALSEIMSPKPARSWDWLLLNAGHIEHFFYLIRDADDEELLGSFFSTHPGVVIVERFFLGHRALSSASPQAARFTLSHTLYRNHGYDPLTLSAESGERDAAMTYPCNSWIFSRATRVVSGSSWVESEARKWYGSKLPRFEVVEGLSLPNDSILARRRQRSHWNVGINDKVFIVFLIGGIEGRDTVLNAWQKEGLDRNPQLRLVFFDDKAGLRGAGKGDVGLEEIEYVDALSGSDIVICLTSLKALGEPRPVFDALAFGKFTICNTPPSPIDELLSSAGVRLPALPAVEEMMQAMRMGSEVCREVVGLRVSVLDASESSIRPSFEAVNAIRTFSFARGLAQIKGFSRPADGDVKAVARAMAESLPRVGQRQVLIDISELCKIDSKSGIQRVVRGLLWHFVRHSPAGYRAEPIYWEGETFRYARRFTAGLVAPGLESFDDSPVEVDSGDVFLGIDLNCEIARDAARTKLENWRIRGVYLVSVVYDLLPVNHPEWFMTGLRSAYVDWLECVASTMDGVVAISGAVANELKEYLAGLHCSRRTNPIRIGHFHLGADVEESLPTLGGGLPVQALVSSSVPTILMVGTIEPRKGHCQALDAFDLLWSRGVAAHLVIVGKGGWMVDPLISRIESHGEIGQRLFWFKDLTDEHLMGLYKTSSALLAASEGEGFGLPLIEAARHGIPIIARDLPVFKEVAQDHAFYFSGHSGDALAESVAKWLELHAAGKAPSSSGLQWLTWEQSSVQLWAEVVRQIGSD